jgi:large subunit ribosomal protein L30
MKKNEATGKPEAAGQAKKAAKAAAAPSHVHITQLRAALDTKQLLALRGLGLRRIRHSVAVVDTPSTRGLILKVRHLVEVKGA